jgi:hypothetical protein
LNLIFKEIEKLLNTPKEDLKKLIEKNSGIMEYNYKRVNEFALSEIDKIYKLFDVQ